MSAAVGFSRKTTQVPSIDEVAVVGAAPTGIDGVRFHVRRNPDRLHLTFDEIAALEAIRAWPTHGESDAEVLEDAVRRLVGEGRIRPERLVKVGVLLTGTALDAADAGVMTIGLLYHLLNGTAFSVAYALLLGRRQAGVAWALVTGVAWGIGLELFQLTIYPGWLEIRAYEEFVRVSFLGHVVYGATVGLGTRYLLRRL